LGRGAERSGDLAGRKAEREPGDGLGVVEGGPGGGGRTGQGAPPPSEGDRVEIRVPVA